MWFDAADLQHIALANDFFIIAVVITSRRIFYDDDFLFVLNFNAAVSSVLLFQSSVYNSIYLDLIRRLVDFQLGESLFPINCLIFFSLFYF